MKKLFWLIPALLVLAGIPAGIFARNWYVDRKLPAFSKDYVLYVYPDTSPDEVADSLISGAGAKSVKSLMRSFRKEKLEGTVAPGRYVVDTKVSATYAARMLKFGWQTPQNLVLSGSIRSRDKLVKSISRQMMVDSLTVANALRDNDFLSQFGVDSLDFFTIVLPDTYQIYWTSSISDIFARLRKEYDAYWTEDRLAKAAALGLTPHEVSVLASIVQGETNRKEDYSKIACVYLNRLRRGMKLQACPTVCYIFGYTLNRVLNKHLAVDSPYNTYIYPGLPPTPICSPSKDCLEGTLNPDTHDYLFFCASPEFDGTHRFATTYAEHQRNAVAFQTALNKRNAAKKAN